MHGLGPTPVQGISCFQRTVLNDGVCQQFWFLFHNLCFVKLAFPLNFDFVTGLRYLLIVRSYLSDRVSPLGVLRSLKGRQLQP